jgi:hypothetical protein
MTKYYVAVYFETLTKHLNMYKLCQNIGFYILWLLVNMFTPELQIGVCDIIYTDLLCSILLIWLI